MSNEIGFTSARSFINNGANFVYTIKYKTVQFHVSIYSKYCLANARRNLICRVEAASRFTSSLLFEFNSNWPKAAICVYGKQ